MRHRFALVAVEGLACVGKTTLLQRLAMAHPDLRVVPEVVPEAERMPVALSDPSTSVLNIGRYLGNDILKSHSALRHTATKPCALDRYYVSTLAHRCAELSLHGRELNMRVRAAMADFSILLTQPDVWIYVTETPKIAWERYIRLRRSDPESCWSTERGTRAIADALLCCMNVLSETSVVVQVSSESLNEDDATGSILARLGQLIALPRSA